MLKTCANYDDTDNKLNWTYQVLYGLMARVSDCEVLAHGFNSHSVMKNFFYFKFMLLEMVYLL